MIKRKTVFVVGAGASEEFGFPIGRELRTRISELLAMGSLDDTIREAFHVHDVRRLSDYIVASAALSRSVPGYRSIDRALAFGNENPELTARMRLAGKLAIAKIILDREAQCGMAERPDEVFSLARFNGTWLGELLILLQEHASPDRPEEIFENISFVCFNYDRCIEQFLFRAMIELQHCDRHRAAKIIRNLNIFHPFGAVGGLPWMEDYDPARLQLDFGRIPHGVDLLAAANVLQTMGYTPTEEETTPARQALETARQIVFLGFGFDPDNLALIKPPRGSTARTFATMYEVSDAAQRLNRQRISAFLKGDRVAARDPQIVSMKCAEFITSYGDELTL